MGKLLLQLLKKSSHTALFMVVFLLGTTAFNAQAQQYPVQSNLTVNPPYSLHLSDYVAPGSDRLSLMVLLKDLEKAELGVRFRLTIEGAGVIIRTRAGFLPQPLYLQGGLPEYLTGSDLSQYFEPQNLDFVRGITRREYQQSGRLPEGVYRLCLQVVDAQRNNVISNAGCVTAWMMLNNPPLLNIPANNDKPVAVEPQQLNFQWTPLHSASPNSAFTTEYLFQLYEVYPANRNPEDIVRSAQPVYQTTTSSTSLFYGISETPLVPGRQYAWRVKAYDTEGRDLFKNDGYSNTSVFQWGEVCTETGSVEANAPNIENLDVSWEGADGHTEYVLQYRLQGDDEWYEETTFLNQVTLTDLEPGAIYEYRLKGLCGSISGPFSAVQEITMPEPVEGDFACGTEVKQLELDATTLTSSLKAGDVITAGDFDVKLLKVDGSGSFSGQGLIVIPMMNRMKVAVEFSNIKVNEDFQLVDGFMRVTKATVQVLDDATIAKVNNALEEIKGAFDKANDVLDKVDQVIETANAITGNAGDDSWIDESEYADMTAEELVQAGVALIEEAQETLAGDITSPEAIETMRKGAQLVKRAVAMGADINSAVRNSMQEAKETIDAFVVQFVADSNQKFGMDKNTEPAIKHKYEQLLVGEESRPVAWKSVETGKQDAVLVELLPEVEGISLDDVSFASEMGGTIVPQSLTATQKKLNVQGRIHQEVEHIYATIPAEQDDSEGTSEENNEGEAEENSEGDTEEEQEPEPQVVGKLNVISYNAEYKSVVLVPVGPVETRPDASRVEEELDKIYKGAVVDWTVTVADQLNVEWDIVKDDKLDDGPSGMFTNYTDEMKAIIRAMENKGINDDTYYLFLVPQAKSDPNKAGFMPRKRQFGFIYETAHKDSNGQATDEFVQTVAHELGHGVFRLEHTFKDFTAMAKGTTDNLMDYADGTRLNKYQWDYIHDPVAMAGWAQDEGDAEYVEEGIINEVARLINHIRCAKSRGDDFLPTYYGRSVLDPSDFKLSVLIENHKLGVNGAATVPDHLKELDMSVLFTGKYSIAALSTYEDVTLDLSKIKVESSFGKQSLIIPGNTGDFKITAYGTFDDEDELAAINWFKEQSGLVGNTNNLSPKFDSSKLYEIEDLVTFSKCDYKLISIENRKKYFESIDEGYLKKGIQDRDTYQQVLANLINFIPEADLIAFYNYFNTNPQLVVEWFELMDIRQADLMIAGLSRLWLKQPGFENIIETTEAHFTITKSIFGHPDNSVNLTKDGYVVFNKDHYEVSAFGKEGTDGLDHTFVEDFRLHIFDPIVIFVEDESSENSGTFKPLPVPAIAVRSCVKKGNIENMKAAAWLTADIVSLAFGVGEINAAIKAAKGSRKIYHIAKAAMAGIDLFATASSINCSTNASNTQGFCNWWNEIEVYVSIGLITGGAADALYGKLISNYSELKAAGKLSDTDINFFENILGIKAISPTIYNGIDEVEDIAKYGDAFVESRNGVKGLTARYGEDWIFIKFDTETVRIVDELQSLTTNDLSDILKLANNKPDRFYEICEVAAASKLPVDKIDDQIEAIYDVVDDAGKSKSDAVNLFVMGGCFLPGTPVSTAQGFKSIEHIQTGDSVWAYNTKTGQEELEVVAKTFIRQSNRVYHIAVGKDTIHATGEHPFYVGGKWVQAEDLQSGEYLFRFGQVREKIRSISIQDTAVNVYNFAVNRLVSYYVGDAQVLVHNTSKNLTLLNSKLDDAVGDVSDLREILSGNAQWLDEFAGNPGLVDAWLTLRNNASAIEKAIPDNLENLKKLNNYIAESGADIDKLKSTFKNSLDPQKWIDMKIPQTELEDIWSKVSDPLAKRDAWTPEHKAQRWNNYKEGCVQAGKDCLDFEGWSNVYDGNINKAKNGDQAVQDYVAAEGLDIPSKDLERTWKDKKGEDVIFNVSIKDRSNGGYKTISGKRRHDVYDEVNEKVIEVKHYTSNKVYLSEEIEREVMMDIDILNSDKVRQVEWVFTANGPSAPLRKLLEDNDIIVKILN